MTSLGDDVFVVRWGGKEVGVYDGATFTLRGRIAVPRLGYSYGLAACAHNKCLYVSDCSHDSFHDSFHDRLHAVELSGRNAVTKWSVAGRPAGLSVNKACNVLVACYKAEKVQEYTTYGTPVREVRLKAPWHAVQLSTGHYVVSQSTSPGAVSIVGVDGQVVRSYRPSRASDDRRMEAPMNLVVTQNDDILVADTYNDRILSMDGSLSSVQELVLSADERMQEPFGLCLDKARGRLFVGECSGSSRVMLLDMTLCDWLNLSAL